MNKTVSMLLAAFALSMSDAKAETYSFFSITNNKAADATAGAAQLTMEVTDFGTATDGKVSFKFFNSGPKAMSITDIYFDDGTLLQIDGANIDDSGAGVKFAIGASPWNLPGGNDYDFRPERNGIKNSFFGVDSESPTQPMGVNPGEWLEIVYDLQWNATHTAKLTYSDVLNALALAQNNIQQDTVGGLRVGIHVQGFAGGGSESFINGPAEGAPNPVPDSPVTATLLGLALLGIGIGRRCIA